MEKKYSLIATSLLTLLLSTGASTATAFTFQLLPAPSGGYTIDGDCDVGQSVKVTAYLAGNPQVPGVTFFKHQAFCGGINTIPSTPQKAKYFNLPAPKKFVFSSTPPKPQPAQLRPGMWTFEAEQFGPVGTQALKPVHMLIP
jgi:hypothetical protein